VLTASPVIAAAAELAQHLGGTADCAARENATRDGTVHRRLTLSAASPATARKFGRTAFRRSHPGHFMNAHDDRAGNKRGRAQFMKWPVYVRRRTDTFVLRVHKGSGWAIERMAAEQHSSRSRLPRPVAAFAIGKFGQGVLGGFPTECTRWRFNGDYACVQATLRPGAAGRSRSCLR